jgi:hypothetical protein
MDIWDADKLLLFIAFAIPGFISLKLYETVFPSEPRASSERVIDAVAYSCINYAVLVWPIYEVETQQLRVTNPHGYIAFYVFVLLIAPALLVLVYAALRRANLMQNVLPHPTEKPWDFVFGKRFPYWVIVTLQDGNKIAGRYGERSFASSAPAPAQLYLEEAWVFKDDGFERQRTDTAGILILGPDIVSVELVNIKRTDE